ncbi:hypothetical protein [Oceanobacillus sp. CF4.6]|uniref:hypothetical protein n=1 Tax=Oceanobacillus sp. CF4.6 TaxID=3373080 RepID=UPI003EE5F247
MEKYPFNHAYGSLIYREENYHFRYKGVSAAEISLFHVPGEEYHFQCHIYEDNNHWIYLPQEIREFNSSNKKVFEKFGVSPCGSGLFQTKEEALQKAITVIEKILGTYENDKPKI